jgi:GntR family transcriptional regulator
MTDQQPEQAAYLRISANLRDRIISGDLSPGDRLPASRTLAAEFQVSRATADKAIQVILREGLAFSRPRMSVTVADTNRATGLDDRAASVRATGNALAKNETSRILLTGFVPCPPGIAVSLGVEEGSPVMCRRRVTSKDDKPVGVSSSYYTPEVAELTPELAEPVSIPSGSRELVIERLGGGKVTKRVEYTAHPVSARREEAELLGLEDDGAVLQADRVVTMLDGRVVEVASKVTDGSRPVVTYC